MTSPILGSEPSTSQHEASQHFLKRLPDPKDRAASFGVSPGAGTMAAANASLIVVEDGAEDVEWGCWGQGK